MRRLGLSLLPGLAIVAVLAIAASAIAHLEHVVPDVAVALVLGILVANLAGRLRAESLQALRPGVACVLKYVLRTAIVLFGAGLSVAAIGAIGAATSVLVAACFTISLTLGYLFARLTKLPKRIGTLIGAGTAICGGTAILAIAPLLGADDEEQAYALTTIFAFNLIALLTYPAIGTALALSPIAFGSWAGTAINDTSVVVATGYIYGHAAGAVATVVKLTRTLLLVPLAFAFAFAAATRTTSAGSSTPRVGQDALLRAMTTMPWFVFGFVAVAAANSFGLLSGTVRDAAVRIASFCMVMVLAAVGLNTDLAKMRAFGARPLLVGFALATVMSVCSFALIRALHIGA